MPCGCPTRLAVGFTLTVHREPCAWAPVDVCADCGYDIVPGQDHELELCPNTAAVEVCRHCGQPITPNRMFGWVHAAGAGHHYCATNQVTDHAEPAAA